VTIEPGSAASRQHVAAQLRRYRSENELSVEDVAEALGWSCRQLCRIESGRRRISSEELTRLMVEYYVDDAERAALVAIARDSEQRWQPVSPVHRLIAEDMRRRIELGELSPGLHLPTERELRNDYGVSRHTIRDAIRWLIRRGLVETRPGQGMFVVDEVDFLATTHTTGEENSIQNEGATHAPKVTAPETRLSSIARHIDLQPQVALTECVAESDVFESLFSNVVRIELQPLLVFQVWADILLDFQHRVFDSMLVNAAQDALHETTHRILAIWLASNRDNVTPIQVELVTLLENLTGVGLRQRLPAQVPGPLGLLAPVRFSPQRSAHDRKSRSGQTLGKHTFQLFSCSNRGTAVAA
jgi:DNA-binding transcriptional regulator YhcF (GntR family)